MTWQIDAGKILSDEGHAITRIVIHRASKIGPTLLNISLTPANSLAYVKQGDANIGTGEMCDSCDVKTVFVGVVTLEAPVQCCHEYSKQTECLIYLNQS